MKTYTFFVAPEGWDLDPTALKIYIGRGRDIKSALRRVAQGNYKAEERFDAADWINFNAVVVAIEGNHAYNLAGAL